MGSFATGASSGKSATDRPVGMQPSIAGRQPARNPLRLAPAPRRLARPSWPPGLSKVSVPILPGGQIRASEDCELVAAKLERPVA